MDGPRLDRCERGGSRRGRPAVHKGVAPAIGGVLPPVGDLSDPRISPLYGKLVGLPPVQLHMGEDDILLDDTRRYAARLAAAGGDGDAHVWTGMPHVFPADIDMLDAAPAALDSVAGFLRALLQERS